MQHSLCVSDSVKIVDQLFVCHHNFATWLVPLTHQFEDVV